MTSDRRSSDKRRTVGQFRSVSGNFMYTRMRKLLETVQTVQLSGFYEDRCPMKKTRKYFKNMHFDQIYDRADCLTVAEKYLQAAIESREKGRFFCPDCGKTNVTAKKTTWACWSCGTHEGRADATGLVACALAIDRDAAAKLLASDLGIITDPSTHSTEGRSKINPPTIRPTHNRPQAGPEPYELESWAAALANACRAAHERLVGRECDTSRRAWDYLTGPERNLTPETISLHGLGLNLEWIDFHKPLPGSDKPCKLPPGIVIPWHAGPLGIAGVNVREFHIGLKDKYLMATGSRRRWMFPGLLPWAGPVLIVEGEFDAMVADQELSGLLPVATLGGAKCKPEDTFDGVNLGKFSRLLIAADSDDAGHECRAMWRDFSPRRAESIDLPGGKDLSDAVAAGADLKSWIMNTCTDLGIDLRQLPGLIWEQPLGTIRGRLLEPVPGRNNGGESAVIGGD